MYNKVINTLSFEKDDKFNRKAVAINIINIIKNGTFNDLENESLVIALNAPWGSGKTQFLHMWETLIAKEFKDNFDSVYYNAWENDDFNHPLIPLLTEVYRNYDQLHGLLVIAEKIITGFGIGVTQALKNKTGFDIKAILKGVKENTEDYRISNYIEHKNRRVQLGTRLNAIHNNGKKTIVFVDELDRCNPLFAIKTLESIKHFFSIKNVTFVFALDMNQLAHTVATYYGQEIDTVGYLARFFDLQFRLPKPTIKLYIKHLISQYESNFKSTDVPISEDGKLFNKMIEICNELELSLREMNIVFRTFMLFAINYNLFIGNSYRSTTLYFYLILLKYKYPDKYHSILYLVSSHSNWSRFKLKNGTERSITFLGDINEFLHDFEDKRNRASKKWYEQQKLDIEKSTKLNDQNKMSSLDSWSRWLNTYNILVIDDDIGYDEAIGVYVARKLEYLDYVE